MGQQVLVLNTSGLRLFNAPGLRSSTLLFEEADN